MFGIHRFGPSPTASPRPSNCEKFTNASERGSQFESPLLHQEVDSSASSRRRAARQVRGHDGRDRCARIWSKATASARANPSQRPLSARSFLMRRERGPFWTPIEGCFLRARPPRAAAGQAGTSKSTSSLRKDLAGSNWHGGLLWHCV